MAARVLSTQEMKIATEDDVVLVRRAVRALAERRGFDSFATAALTTAVTELGRNIWVHARSGRPSSRSWRTARGPECEWSSRTRGQASRISSGPWRAATAPPSSLGLGLSGTKRLVDDFQLQSEVGRGTSVRITKWKRF